MSFVTIATFPQYYSAAPAKSLLESEGIYCHLRDEHVSTTGEPMASVIDGVKLEVHEKDYNRAKDILTQHGYEVLTGAGYKPTAIKPKTVYRILWVLVPLTLCILTYVVFKVEYITPFVRKMDHEEIIYALRSENKNSKFMACSNIDGIEDTTLVIYLLEHIYDKSVSLHINYKGMSVHYVVVGALRRMSGLEPPIKNSQFHYSQENTDFYLNWAMDKGFIWIDRFTHRG